jgi:hypothetical protein
VHGCFYALDLQRALRSLSAVCICSASTACYRAPCAISIVFLVVLLFTILCCAGAGWLVSPVSVWCSCLLAVPSECACVYMYMFVSVLAAGQRAVRS